MAVGVWLSFTNYDGLNVNNIKWVGAAWYERFPRDRQAVESLKLVFIWTALNTPTWLALSFVLAFITSSMAGFAFASLEGPGKRLYFGIIIAMLMIPAIVFIIPQFVIFARLRLTGTYWPWFLWGISGNAFHIFLFRQFFAGFPKEL